MRLIMRDVSLHTSLYSQYSLPHLIPEHYITTWKKLDLERVFLPRSLFTWFIAQLALMPLLKVTKVVLGKLKVWQLLLPGVQRWFSELVTRTASKGSLVIFHHSLYLTDVKIPETIVIVYPVKRKWVNKRLLKENGVWLC